MSIIEEYLKNANNLWVTTKNTEVNDRFTIKSEPVKDDSSFKGKSYLVFDVTKDKTGEEMKLRLGPQQILALSKGGMGTQSWVNKKIFVASKTTYSGLGKEGLIFAAIQTQ